MSGASADILSAIQSIWNSSGISSQFTAYWSAANIAEYVVLCGDQAEGAHPFPYCVFEMQESKVVSRMTTGTSTKREIRHTSCKFTVYARDVGDADSPKEIAANLILEITKVFGGHHTEANQIDGHAMSNGHILKSQYQNDLAIMEDVEVYKWVVRYSIESDVVVKA